MADSTGVDLRTLALSERLRLVASRRAGLALALWGEVGIGKSHAARGLLEALPCRSLSLAASAPAAKLALELPRPPKLSAWAARTLERAGEAQRLEPDALSAALGAALAGLAPFVLHLEDIHEASPERLELLERLARTVPKLRGAGLLVTSRSEPPEGFLAFKLEPLTRESSDEVLEAEVGAALPEAAMAWMFEKAAGNPLYTLEFFRYLARQGFLWNDGGRWRWREPPAGFLPTTVEALIEHLLARPRSSDPERYTLETRALLPEASSEVWLRTARLSPEDLQGALKSLSQQGVFRGDGFAHPLFREVALKTLSTERRRHLSRRALAALEDDPEGAAPFIAGADLEPSVAQAWLERAAAAALGRDPVRAAQLLAEAARYAEGEARGRLALAAASGLKGWDNAEALRLAQLALASAPSDEARYVLAELLSQQHRLREAEVLLEQLGEAEASVQGPLRCARIYVAAADFKKLLELHERRPEIVGSDPHVDYTLGYAYLYTGQDERAAALAKRSLAQPELRDFERARFLGLLETLAADRGEYQEALHISELRIALYRRSPQRSALASALEKRAELLEHVVETVSDTAERLAQLREAQQLFAVAGDPRRLAGTQAELAYALIQTGDYEEAETLLREARAMLAGLEASDSHLLVEAFLALLYHEWRPQHALSLALHHAEAVTRFEGEWLWPIMVAGASWTVALVQTWAGGPERALRLAEAGAATAASLKQHNILACHLWAQGQALEVLGRREAARRALSEALGAFRRAGFEVRAQRVGLELDRLTGDVDSARARAAWSEERGLQNGVNLARRYFPALADPKALTSGARVALRLEFLGPPQTRLESGTPLRGRKRQGLLALLLEARVSGRSEVPKLALLDALYPGEDELRAASSLKELVHDLRESLGGSLVRTTAAGYALGECASDVEAFLATGETSLWRGPYLEGLGAESLVREPLYLALHRKAEELLATDPREAARVGRILLEAEPYQTASLTTFLRALRALGNRRSLERQYGAARERMLEVGEELPERWQDFLGETP